MRFDKSIALGIGNGPRYPLIASNLRDYLERLKAAEMEWTPPSLRGNGHERGPPEPTGINVPIYGPPRFCNPDLRWRVGLLKSIRRRCGDCSPRHDEIRA
jgi:hypothetical protein